MSPSFLELLLILDGEAHLGLIVQMRANSTGGLTVVGAQQLFQLQPGRPVGTPWVARGLDERIVNG